MDEDSASTVMLLGVGNLLLGDDGVGVHVVQALAGRPEALPAGTVVLDGGTFGLDLAPRLRGVERLVIVDAVAHGAPPGTVGTWRGADVARIFGQPLSVHQAGVEALLGALALLDISPPEIVVVGVEPADVSVGLVLSDAVRASLPALLSATVEATHGHIPASPLRAD